MCLLANVIITPYSVPVLHNVEVTKVQLGKGSKTKDKNFQGVPKNGSDSMQTMKCQLNVKRER